MSPERRFFPLPPRKAPTLPPEPDALELLKTARDDRQDAKDQSPEWSPAELDRIWQSTSD